VKSDAPPPHEQIGGSVPCSEQFDLRTIGAGHLFDPRIADACPVLNDGGHEAPFAPFNFVAGRAKRPTCQLQTR
jgi:hypothetical protein